jgi:hypothetical protein
VPLLTSVTDADQIKSEELRTGRSASRPGGDQDDGYGEARGQRDGEEPAGRGDNSAQTTVLTSTEVFSAWTKTFVLRSAATTRAQQGGLLTTGAFPGRAGGWHIMHVIPPAIAGIGQKCTMKGTPTEKMIKTAASDPATMRYGSLSDICLNAA